MTRKALPARRKHITQRVKIGGLRTLYLSVDDETNPSEVWIRIRGDAGAEKVTAFDVIARLISMALQEGIPMADIAARLEGTRSLPAGPVTGDAKIKNCSGTIDYIGRHLLVMFAGREDLAHVKEGK